MEAGFVIGSGLASHASCGITWLGNLIDVLYLLHLVCPWHLQSTTPSSLHLLCLCVTSSSQTSLENLWLDWSRHWLFSEWRYVCCCMGSAARPASGQPTMQNVQIHEAVPSRSPKESFHMAHVLVSSGDPLSPSLPVVVEGVLLCLMWGRKGAAAEGSRSA